MSRSLEMLIRFRDMTAREVMFMESELGDKKRALADVNLLISETVIYQEERGHSTKLLS